MDRANKLPKYIEPKSLYNFDLDLMRTSLMMSDGIEIKTDQEIHEKLDTRNRGINKDPLDQPPLPCDYVKTSFDDEWLGHGFFYKSGYGKTKFDKCLGCTDFDTFDNFVHLAKCQVLLADYDSIRRDFEEVKDLKNEEIDEWLITQFGYISTGQVQRLKEGNLKDLLDEDWVNCVDENDRKLGLRQRGGGRACTFFVNDEYTWTKEGRMKATMMDVKGNGTSELQEPEVKSSLCGFLSYVMAVKGFVFERGVSRALEKVGCQQWSTVHNYAILDTGILWKDHNPATGIEGDRRNVIMLRKAHSRFSGRSDDAVYYSIVQMTDLTEKEQGRSLHKAFRDSGLSSEQVPLSRNPISWNIQCTSTFNALVDFSHWYFLPFEYSPPSAKDLLPSFRMSEKMFRACLQLQGKYIYEHPQKYPEAMKIAYGGEEGGEEEEERKPEEIYQEKKEENQELAGKFGICGEGKSRYSWSWQVELDDSEVYSTILKVTTSKDGKLDMEQIKKWLE